MPQYRQLARSFFSFLAFLVFLLVLFVSGCASVCAKVLGLMLVAAICGIWLREGEHERAPDNPVEAAINGTADALFHVLFERLLKVHVSPAGSLLAGPAVCLTIFQIAVFADALSDRLRFLLLLLPAFYAGFFWPPINESVEILMARLTGEDPRPQSRADRAKNAEDLRQQFRQNIQDERAEQKKAKEERFVALLAPLLVRVAMADGRFVKAELAVILRFFQDKLGYEGARLNRVKRLIQEAMRHPLDLNELVAECDASFDYSARLLLMEVVYELVHVHDPALKAQLRLARDMGRRLGLFTTDLRGIESKYRFREARPEASGAGARRARPAGEDRKRQDDAGAGEQDTGRRAASSRPASAEAEALALLGLTPGADFQAIKTAWRRLLQQYHPDKFAHLDPEFQRIAADKTRAVNAAYRLLAQAREAGP